VIVPETGLCGCGSFSHTEKEGEFGPPSPASAQSVAPRTACAFVGRQFFSSERARGSCFGFFFPCGAVLVRVSDDPLGLVRSCSMFFSVPPPSATFVCAPWSLSLRMGESELLRVFLTRRRPRSVSVAPLCVCEGRYWLSVVGGPSPCGLVADCLLVGFLSGGGVSFVADFSDFVFCWSGWVVFEFSCVSVGPLDFSGDLIQVMGRPFFVPPRFWSFSRDERVLGLFVWVGAPF